MKIGRYDEALKLINHSITIYSDLSAAWRARGQCLSQLGKFDEAEYSFQKASELRPENLDAMIDLAILKLSTNQREQGRKFLESALSTDPQEPRAKELYEQHFHANS
jgi:Flp pilus assembly protein TadD